MLFQGKLRKKLEIFPKYRENWIVVQPHKITGGEKNT